MDKLLYVAMSGAKQILEAQTMHANNLANNTTTGFKEDLDQFKSMPVYGDHYPSRVYAMVELPGSNLEAGPMIPTHRDLDIAINGEGWIAVQSKTGDEAYTRAGNLVLDSQGFLKTSTGLHVIGTGGLINLPSSVKIEIGTDGTISFLPKDSKGAALVVADRIKLVNPVSQDLTKGLDGLFRQKNGTPAEINTSVHVNASTLEGSNVNVVSAITKMIGLARQFELQLKMMNAAGDNESATAQMLQIG